MIIREGLPQTISARFIYGPFDMFSLAGMYLFRFQIFIKKILNAILSKISKGEKVDIHIIREPGNGEWTHLSTEDSDKNGRVTYTIPDSKSLGFGIYPVKMVVR